MPLFVANLSFGWNHATEAGFRKALRSNDYTLAACTSSLLAGLGSRSLACPTKWLIDRSLLFTVILVSRVNIAPEYRPIFANTKSTVSSLRSN